jgi:hypothetical protein
VIDQIRELMIGQQRLSARRSWAEKQAAAAAAEAAATARKMEQEDSRRLFGIQEDFNS